MQKKRLGLVITDGVGFRNFILSNFLKEAKLQFNEVIIYSCLDQDVYKDHVKEHKIVELKVYKENFFTWFFMKLKEVAHLQLSKDNNFGIQDSFNINRVFNSTNRGLAKRFIFFITRFLKSEFWIQRFNSLQQATFKNNPITRDYIRTLQEDQVDFLFFTHQRPPYIAPLIYASEQLKIPNGTFIFSWDNIASKGRMAGNFDYYFVWSKLMKTELLQFYSQIKETQIHIVGTPQFEPYAFEEYGYSKKIVFEKFDLDINLPTILFTCNDSSSENDPIYLETLARFIHENRLVKKVNLLVRTSPAESPERFKFITDKFKFIKWNYPDWTSVRQNHQEAWSQRVPSLQDLSDLKSMLKYCDLCINVLSTITLDAFIFNKPVINPVFGNTENSLYNDQKFLKYAHLENLVKSNASLISKNEDAYLEHINHILNNFDAKEAERNKFINLQIGVPLEHTSKKIVESIFSNL